MRLRKVDLVRAGEKRHDSARGFEVLPCPWVVERTFAWLRRCRRSAARALPERLLNGAMSGGRPPLAPSERFNALESGSPTHHGTSAFGFSRIAGFAQPQIALVNVPETGLSPDPSPPGNH